MQHLKPTCIWIASGINSMNSINHMKTTVLKRIKFTTLRNIIKPFWTWVALLCIMYSQWNGNVQFEQCQKYNCSLSCHDLWKMLITAPTNSTQYLITYPKHTEETKYAVISHYLF